MHLKRLIVPGLTATALAVALTMPIGAEDGSVDASVTPLVLAASVNVQTVDYQTLEYSNDNIDRSSRMSQMITATNQSSITANLKIRGDDATPATQGHSEWDISCTPADFGAVNVDQFVHRVAVGAGENPDFNNNAHKALCEGANIKLQDGVNTGGMADFVLQLSMPLGSSVGDSKRSTSVTVVAVDPSAP